MQINTLALIPQSALTWLLIEAIGILAVIVGFFVWLRFRQPPK
jgi:hypothetical protein